jgi:uncharacterized protein HemX
VNEASAPGQAPPRRRRFSPWVPILLVCLALLTLIGGLSVGDFYWNDLRPDMGRIGSNLVEVRDRQRTMLANFAEAQALLLESQRHLVAQANDLRRREQSLYEARLEVDAQRAQLAARLEAEVERERIAAARLTDAAGRVRSAAEIRRDDELDGPAAALTLAEALLAQLPGPIGKPGRVALAQAKVALGAVHPVDRQALLARLDALRERALTLRPVVARLLRGKANGEKAAEARQRPDDPVTQASRSLGSQFDAARLALESADQIAYQGAMQGIQRWLAAFYEPRLPDTAAVLADLKPLAEVQIGAHLGSLNQALAALADALQGIATGAANK